MNWDEILTWQAQVTDAIDREEAEISIYQTLEKVLVVRLDQAKRLHRVVEIEEIESHLANIHLLVKMKRLIIKQWEAQFRTMAQAICS